jgi:hypothetical protein
MDDVSQPGRGSHGGDGRLATLLEREGSPYDVAGVRQLLAGVRAAPPGHDPEAWMTLVVATPSPALKSAHL